ncbi:MAG: trypsin-like peptidase domain-containing protein [Pseudomonadota bacterium]|nr:trypsin-like peptidase domain-containing protein [Pseudomonadota bacterium]
MHHKNWLYPALAALIVSGNVLAQDNETTSIDRSTARAEAADVSKFTTREARLQAQPLDWDATRGTVTEAPAISPEARDADVGEPGSSPGEAPDPQAEDDARASFPDDWKGLEESEAEARGPETARSADFGTQDVFTQYCENCSGVNLKYPQIAIGKLFTNSGTCSASVVSGKNIIVTAAHCCYNRGNNDWIGGWSFAPAYRDGYAPYGTFPWTSARILNRWISHGDRRSDVCLISLGKNSSGKNVAYYTGWLGRSWNWPSTQIHHAVGYPGNIGNGQKKELCVSESFSPSGSCGGTTVLNTGCSMTYGASGGPWVRSYRNSNWVNSVVSGYDSGSCTGSFGQTFNGPRFTSNNIKTLCDHHGC